MCGQNFWRKVPHTHSVHIPCPIFRKTYTDDHRLYQDIPKHTSWFIQALFVKNRINWWKSPAESPNLNPIEEVWGSMKDFLRDKHKPRNIAELKEGIKKFWSTRTHRCAADILITFGRWCQMSSRLMEPFLDIRTCIAIAWLFLLLLYCYHWCISCNHLCVKLTLWLTNVRTIDNHKHFLCIILVQQL